MSKTLIGIAVGLLIGAGCRWFDIPVPSPPKLLGALLVVSMTVGYLATDKVLSRHNHFTADSQQIRHNPLSQVHTRGRG